MSADVSIDGLSVKEIRILITGLLDYRGVAGATTEELAAMVTTLSEVVASAAVIVHSIDLIDRGEISIDWNGEDIVLHRRGAPVVAE